MSNNLLKFFLEKNEELEILFEIICKQNLLIEILSEIVKNCSKTDLNNCLIKTIQLQKITEINLINDVLKEKIWIPKHVSELDKCAHVVIKYEPTEDPKHPVN